MTDKDGKKNKHLPDHFCKPTEEDRSRTRNAHFRHDAETSKQISDFPQNQAKFLKLNITSDLRTILISNKKTKPKSRDGHASLS